MYTVQKQIHSTYVALKSHCGGERDEEKEPEKTWGRANNKSKTKKHWDMMH